MENPTENFVQASLLAGDRSERLICG